MTASEAGLPNGWAVLGATPRALIVTDPSGVVVAWNRAASSLYGWTAEEAVGRLVTELISIGHEMERDAADLRSLAAGKARTGDRWVRDRDGSPMLVRTASQPVLGDDGQVVAIVGVSEDVTEQRRTEERVAALMQQLRTALDAGGLGIWHWDARTGHTEWDGELERIFGLPPGGFDGTFDTFAAMLHPDDRDHVLATVDDAMRSGARYRVEHRIVRPDGAVRWIRGAGSVIVDEGTSLGSVGCAADVTDEVEATLELHRVKDEALRAAAGERVQRQRLEFVGRVNDALADSASVHDVMVRVARALVPDLGTWCSLYVLDEAGGDIPLNETWHADPMMVEYARHLQSRFPYDPDADHGIPAVIRERRSEFVPEIDKHLLAALDLPDEVRDIVHDLGLSSSITVPLIKGRRVLGALHLVTAHQTRRYTDQDVSLAEALAGRIAATIDNIRLREDARSTSTILQRSLLPAELPDLPDVELAVRYWPAGEGMVVGGDFYDVFETAHVDRWAIVIGDVCGTGPHAASLTGLARHTARDAAWHGDTPDDVLRAIHRALQRSGSMTFLTAVFGQLDLVGGKPSLTMAVGGHPLPLLVRNGIVTPIGSHGTLLGLLDNPHLTATTHELEFGDLLVLYTDGATDMRPPLTIDPDEFAQLVARCASDAGHSAEVMADALGDAFNAVHPFDQRNDDIAAIVLRVAS